MMIETRLRNRTSDDNVIENSGGNGGLGHEDVTCEELGNHCHVYRWARRRIASDWKFEGLDKLTKDENETKHRHRLLVEKCQRLADFRPISSSRRTYSCLTMLSLVMFLFPNGISGFVPVAENLAIVSPSPSLKKQLCFMSIKDDDGGGGSGGDARKSEDGIGDMFGEDLDTGGVVIEDLNWRVEKLRLEEQNTQRFLKSRPRFLPYNECRKWVQAFGRWETEEDWRQWISMGEKRNAYIPSRPDEYYGRLGQWISWEHFLKIDPDEDESSTTEC